MMANHWTEVPEAELPETSFAMNLVPVKQRLIYSFGDGMNRVNQFVPNNREKFLLFDIIDMRRGW